MTQPCDICGAASVMTDGICNAYLCDRSECLDTAWGRAFLNQSVRPDGADQ